MNEINFHTIAYLQRYVQSYGLPKLSIRGLGQIYDHALVALPGKPTPSVKDHRKARNPYYSRYGERWVEKLKTSSSMSKLCCITDLIRFMMKEAENLMKTCSSPRWAVRSHSLVCSENSLLIVGIGPILNK